MTKTQHEIYQKGHLARMDGKNKYACPVELSTVLRGFWLAGWNDADIEMSMKSDVTCYNKPCEK